MTYRGILFGLDDTLVNTRLSATRFIGYFYDNFEYDIKESNIEEVRQIFMSAVQTGYKETEEMLHSVINAIPWKNTPLLKELTEYWYEIYPKCLEPVDGLYEVLQFFRSREIPMGIVTNGSSVLQNVKIDKLGIKNYMDAVIISEEANVRKPDRKIFELALSKLGLKARETLFVGDNADLDIKGAADAGIVPVWMKYDEEWKRNYKRPKYIIKSLKELIHLFDENLM